MERGLKRSAGSPVWGPEVKSGKRGVKRPRKVWSHVKGKFGRNERRNVSKIFLNKRVQFGNTFGQFESDRFGVTKNRVIKRSKNGHGAIGINDCGTESRRTIMLVKMRHEQWKDGEVSRIQVGNNFSQIKVNKEKL